MRNNIIAFILARGGSKGLPGKNLAVLNEKPLIVHTIAAALNADAVKRVIVSSDCDEILNISAQAGAEVFKRPPDLALDNTTSAESLMHLLSEQIDVTGFSIGLLLQPTSPLRTASNINEAVKLAIDNNAAVISVYEPDEHPAKAFKLTPDGKLEGLYSDGAPYTPRQKLPTAYMPNGAIYIFDIKKFVQETDFPRQNILPYLMSVENSIDIDTQSDLDKAEVIMKERDYD